MRRRPHLTSESVAFNRAVDPRREKKMNGRLWISVEALVVIVLVCLVTAAVMPDTRADTPAAQAAAVEASPPARIRPSSPMSAPRNDAWTVVGVGGGGAQFIPAVSPHMPNVVLVRCDMTGAYISHDAGESWRMYNLRGGVRFFLFDPVDADIIYTATGSGLYRSTDRGSTWALVFPDPATVVGSAMPDDHAGERFITSDGRRRSIQAMAVDPEDSEVLYAVITEGGASALHVSRDLGRRWRSLGAVAGGASRVFVDKASPAENRTVGIFSAGAVDLLRNNRITRMPTPARFTSFSGGFDSQAGRAILYGTSGNRVYVSHDGGASWNEATSNVALGGTLQRASTIAASENFGEVAYVRITASGGGQTFNGLARTGDGGITWTHVVNTSARPGDRPDAPPNASWFYALYSRDASVASNSLSVAPNHPNIVYGTDFGRTMRTTDGGSTWFACYSDIRADYSATTRGLDVTTTYGYHIDPFNPMRHFITYTDIGLMRSEDGGVTWHISTTDVPRAWRNTTYWIEFDPEVEGLMWGVFCRNHDIPRPKMWRNTDPARYEGGVGISTDGGRTWTASNEGMPQTAPTHILLDPESPVGNRTLYVAATGTGVWKSTDNGKSWELRNNGLDYEQPFAWWIDRDRNGVLYLIVARRSEDGSYNNWRDGALYRSTDGAESWTKVQLPQGVNGPNGIAIDPEDPNRIYLALWGRRTAEDAVNGGIILTTDGGRTWREVLTRDQHIYDVTIDPRDPNILYACGFQHNAWRSDDRGETWSRIKGYNFKWGHRVIPDPFDPDMIYVTTFGGSVWYGPAKGDPDAVEDIVTPEVAYGNFRGRED